MSNGTQNTDGVVATFTERFVQVDGIRIRYLEAGQGSSVVVLHGADRLTQSPLNTLLAQRFRVITFEIPSFGQSPAQKQPSSLRDVARTLTQAAAAAGLDRYVVVSTSVSAPLALWQALDAPECIEALVLISPSGLLFEDRITTSEFKREPELEHKLGDIQAATFVLFGTRDEVIPPETGRLYVERIPDCYYVLVYDAGHTIEAERPEALCAAVCDFVERRGTFIVERNNTAINP